MQPQCKSDVIKHLAFILSDEIQKYRNSRSALQKEIDTLTLEKVKLMIKLNLSAGIYLIYASKSSTLQLLLKVSILYLQIQDFRDFSFVKKKISRMSMK